MYYIVWVCGGVTRGFIICHMNVFFQKSLKIFFLIKIFIKKDSYNLYIAYILHIPQHQQSSRPILQISFMFLLSSAGLWSMIHRCRMMFCLIYPRFCVNVWTSSSLLCGQPEMQVCFL